MTVTISRDPFARSTIERERVATNETCDFCGNRRRTKHGLSGNLFRYGTWNDGVHTRIGWHKGLFCSKPCHDDYHNIR